MLMEVNGHSFSRLSSFHHFWFRGGALHLLFRLGSWDQQDPLLRSSPGRTYCHSNGCLPGNKSGGFSTWSSLLSAPVLILSGILSSKPNLGLQALRQSLRLFLPGDSEQKANSSKPYAFPLQQQHIYGTENFRKKYVSTDYSPPRQTTADILLYFCLYSFLPPLSRNAILCPTY